MQAVNLVVSCANRKKAVPPRELRLGSLAHGPLGLRLERWLERLDRHEVPARRAADLYAGDHWQAAQAIPHEAAGRNLNVRLWVCSAGYGLIRDSDLIKPYSATFAAGHPDSVSDGCSGTATVCQWWLGLGAHSRSKGAHTLLELAAREPYVPVVVIASESYLAAMAPDLKDATGALASEALLSIVSIGATSKRVAPLEAHILPADARFEALVGGTRAALNARVARLLFRQIPQGASPSRELLTLALAHSATELPPLRRFDRRRVSDDQVRRFIEQARRVDSAVSKTRLLRRLRNSGSACEQGRFSAIFNHAGGANTDES